MVIPLYTWRELGTLFFSYLLQDLESLYDACADGDIIIVKKACSKINIHDLKYVSPLHIAAG